MLRKGENIHVIERRLFEDDLRRHFAGVVVDVGQQSIRMVGYVWIFDNSRADFTRKPDRRERVFFPSDRSIINVLPKDVNVAELVYDTDPAGNRVITDGKNFSMDISEFSAHR